MVGVLLASSLLGCSGGSGSASSGTEEPASSIALRLGTTGSNGNRYRLGPAEFKISELWGYPGNDPIVVNATGDADSLSVAVPANEYQVTLTPGWKLQRVAAGETLTPVAATLVSEATVHATVSSFEVTPVNFAFHLGESGIDIGVTVDEGLPAGYDGIIRRMSDGRYSIDFGNNSGACCFVSVAQAKESYPDKNFLVIE